MKRARIVLMDGERGVREYRLDRTRISIGSSGLNQIVIDDPTVSQFHAQVQAEHGVFRISGLGTRQGMEINGQKVEEKALEPGDEIRIGDVLLKFVGDETRSAVTSAGGEGKLRLSISRRAFFAMAVLAVILGLLLLLNAHWIMKLAGR